LKSFRWWGRRFDTAGFDTAGKVATNQLVNKIATNKLGKKVLAPPWLPNEKTPVGSGSAGMPGGMLSLSIDPNQLAEGVLFASVQRCRPTKKDASFNLEKEDPVFHECDVEDCRNSKPEFAQCGQQRFGMLRAFDPFTLHELWNNQTDLFVPDPKLKSYYFVKFVPPTIARNRVFLPTASRRVLVYGLHP
jgi:hypothetical protein